MGTGEKEPGYPRGEVSSLLCDSPAGSGRFSCRERSARALRVPCGQGAAGSLAAGKCKGVWAGCQPLPLKGTLTRGVGLQNKVKPKPTEEKAFRNRRLQLACLEVFQEKLLL